MLSTCVKKSYFEKVAGSKLTFTFNLWFLWQSCLKLTVEYCPGLSTKIWSVLLQRLQPKKSFFSNQSKVSRNIFFYLKRNGLNSWDVIVFVPPSTWCKSWCQIQYKNIMLCMYRYVRIYQTNIILSCWIIKTIYVIIETGTVS